ncbi:putative phd-finger domain-containing protein [Golovinomyces cichoracearum]|uniref:Chromatin modification-related protein n=1 Tax=Golovinomyces cichoracearum TaxID=62708 RepID=A0A420IEA0_9PEZI|nr:putative phd-finger domain-containing protein [Golovinomyces cichoracearum]
MSYGEHHDAATVLDEWTNRVANLPNEIAFMYEEIEQKDSQIAECLVIITKHDTILQNWVRKNGGHVANPKENFINKIVLENYDRAQVLQSEKIAIAQKCQQIIDKHTRNLDTHIKALQDRGEFPIDAELPSLLRDTSAVSVSKVNSTAAHVSTSVSTTTTIATTTAIINPTATIPAATTTTSTTTNIPNTTANSTSTSTVTSTTTQIKGPTPVNIRVSEPIPQSLIQKQSQKQQNSNISASISKNFSPVALVARQSRDTSLISVNKRQNSVSNTISHVSSPSARQTSLGVSILKTSNTPSATRASSTGPRTQLRIGPRKISSHGSNKLNGIGRKYKKSYLSRVKRPGNRISPSPTHDSELSGAESGSVHEEDDLKLNQDGDRNDDVVDNEDDDGVDDRKYCTCQSISYGDMVACDNPNCEFEWFHWSCVGLKSEPLGTWICATCEAAGFKK